MKRETLFLNITVILMGIPVFALCIFLVPALGNVAAKLPPEFAFIKYLVSPVFYASAIPFYFALYQVFNLLRYISFTILIQLSFPYVFIYTSSLREKYSSGSL